MLSISAYYAQHLGLLSPAPRLTKLSITAYYAQHPGLLSPASQLFPMTPAQHTKIHASQHSLAELLSLAFTFPWDSLSFLHAAQDLCWEIPSEAQASTHSLQYFPSGTRGISWRLAYISEEQVLSIQLSHWLKKHHWVLGTASPAVKSTWYELHPTMISSGKAGLTISDSSCVASSVSLKIWIGSDIGFCSYSQKKFEWNHLWKLNFL